MGVRLVVPDLMFDTIFATDAGKKLIFTSASAVTYTVEPESTYNAPEGTKIEVLQDGAGQVTFAEGTGVTIASESGNLSIANQYGSAYLEKSGTSNKWWLIGSLA